MAMEWLESLKTSLRQEFGHDWMVATLATVDRSGAPHARSVICRRIDDEGQIYVVSDARSEKNAQVRGESRVEMVFWLRTLQTQYRIAGEMNVIAFAQDEILRRELWRELSDQLRALFFWPTPSIAVAADDEYPRAVAANVDPPTTFEVLILKPTQVDRLMLDSQPHRRRRWRADANWTGVDVNP